MYKHITPNEMCNIRMAAHHIGLLENGCRNEKRVSNETIINLCEKKARSCSRLPKEYTLWVKETENLGTNKWAEIVTVVNGYCIYKDTNVKETEKSVIIYQGNHKRVIDKSYILCYEW